LFDLGPNFSVYLSVEISPILIKPFHSYKAVSMALATLGRASQRYILKMAVDNWANDRSFEIIKMGF